MDSLPNPRRIAQSIGLASLILAALWWTGIVSMDFAGLFGRPSLVGEWRGIDVTGAEIEMRLGADGSFDLLNDGEGLVDPNAGVTFTYVAVPEYEPARLFLAIDVDDTTHRMPLGIYKFERGKLLFCPVEMFQRTIGGFPFGTARTEFPEGFAGQGCVVLDRH